MSLKRARLSALCFALLMMTGCSTAGGGSEPAARQEDALAIAPAVEAADTPTAEPTSKEEAEAAPQESAPPPSSAIVIEDAAAIDSYRSHIVTVSEDPRGAVTFDVTSAVVKDPPATQIVVDIQERDQTHRQELIFVDGTSFVKSADGWVEVPGAQFHTAYRPGPHARL